MESSRMLFSVLLFLSSWTLAWAANPAFDCVRSAHEIEKLICENEKLAVLDRAMDKIYRVAMQTLPEEEKNLQKSIQRGWIKGRNDCWKETDREACAELEYQRRMTELQIISGQVVVPEAVQYRCDGGEHDSLTAVFYNDTQMPAVVLTRVSSRIDDQDTAYITHPGSGAKYVGNKATFWIKGKEAQGSWLGKDFKCKEL